MNGGESVRTENELLHSLLSGDAVFFSVREENETVGRGRRPSGVSACKRQCLPSDTIVFITPLLMGNFPRG